MEEKNGRTCLNCNSHTPPCELAMIFTWFLGDLAEIMGHGRKNRWNNLDELNHRITKSIDQNQQMADDATTISTLRFSVTKLQLCDDDCVFPISIMIEKGQIEINESKGNALLFLQDSRIEAVFDPS
jgi:hypothetical protein